MVLQWRRSFLLIAKQPKFSEQFRISYTFSFDFMRTVWWCPSCSIGYVWPFIELQLTALSALAPTQKLIGAGSNRNCTGNPLTTGLIDVGRTVFTVPQLMTISPLRNVRKKAKEESRAVEGKV